jgi:hypothetical protein
VIKPKDVARVSSRLPVAVLSGARNRCRSDLAEQLYDRMRTLFPQERSHLIAASTLVSNIFSSIGDDDQSQQIRKDRIQHYGTKLTPGITWTEVNEQIEVSENLLHENRSFESKEFRAHDYHHHRFADEIQIELKRMREDLLADGHQYDSSWITRPLKVGESIESVLCGHSEKLAIAYNFIQKRRPSVIQLTKNLRVCGDCRKCCYFALFFLFLGYLSDEATKRLARIRQVQIIVRDANRIHHFHKNGKCSCQDHF